MHSSRMRTGRSLTVSCSLLPGRCLPGPGGVCLVRGGSPCQGVCLIPGVGGFLPGGCLPGPGRGLPREPPSPPVDRITDTCKNITLATTSLRPVKITYNGISAWRVGRHDSFFTLIAVISDLCTPTSVQIKN